MTATAVTATTPDYDAIVRVVQLYIDGCNDGDIAKFQEAFHEDAWIFCIYADGVLGNGLLTDRFEGWAAFGKENKANNTPIVGRIIAVTQAGDVASVLLGFDSVADPSGSYVDVHALLRIDGVWKITNKTATHSSRGAWAAAK
jgi:hypothetical protein